MNVIENFDLTNYNSYRVTARCAKAYFPVTQDDWLQIYKGNQHEKKVVLGGGYNLILSKTYYEESFIICAENFANISINGNEIKAQAGISLYKLSELALKSGLSGLEVFFDIPGTLGGAVVMNAGASGEEIKGLIEEVIYLDTQTCEVVKVSKENLDFTYRNSFFQNNPHLVIIEVTLVLKRGDREEIKQKMETTRAARWAKQPKEYPNAGSVFKRPQGKFVGPMIEGLGLKGYRIGGAMISEKHAGFIVNYDAATGDDILSLIRHVQDMVKKEFNISLEVEQRII